MRKITLIGICIILLIISGCEYPKIDSDIYQLYDGLTGLNNMTCFEIANYYNTMVDRCMDIAQENMEEGHYNKRVYNDCFKPDLKTHISIVMDSQCDKEGR